ncbi:glycosyltransferase [Spirillospora sp. CA-294931]|uniref:glycosyltransferase n=1 Tax=Spirillospora sp. CA-294931 TaxID=3240042 RepID=UPI003D8D1877
MKIAMLPRHPERDTAAAELAAELGRQGHEVTVHARRDAPGPPDLDHPGPGVRVERVRAGPECPLPEVELPPWVPEFGDLLARRWAHDPPDVAHAHSWMSGLAALQASRLVGRTGHARVPVVQTYPGRPARNRLERLVLQISDAIIATCEKELAELAEQGVAGRHVAVVPYGVDLDLFRPEGPARGQGRAAHRLVVLARRAESKGAATAIEALAGVPDTELVVAGGLGAGAEGLRRTAREAGVDDRVTFLGRIGHDEVPGLLRSADLAVALPWDEPFGMVPLEAMACGVPVVASGVGGHLDTVVGGVTGVHVPPRDPPETARRIRDLLDDPVRRAGMAAAGAARARSRYSWDRVAGDTLAVYAGAGSVAA